MLLKKDQPQMHYILCNKDSIALKILFGRMSLSTTANIGDPHSKVVATEIDSSRLLSTTSCLDSPTTFRSFVPIVSETSICYVLNKSAATIQLKDQQHVIDLLDVFEMTEEIQLVNEGIMMLPRTRKRKQHKLSAKY